jgi:hypothetical protein
LGLRAGVFAHHLGEALSGGADADGDGIVRLGEVVSYVEVAVRSWSRTNLQADETPQHPAHFLSGGSDDLPLAFTPVQAAREALGRLSTQHTPAEQQAAAAALSSSSAERGILTEWLRELDAGFRGAAGSFPKNPLDRAMERLTLDQYRTYRRVIREEPDSQRAKLYRLLPPRQALVALAYLPVSDEPTRWDETAKMWHDKIQRLARGELSGEAFGDWMDDWLRAKGPAPRQEAETARPPG